MFQDVDKAVVAPGVTSSRVSDRDLVPLSTSTDRDVRDKAGLWLSVWFVVALDDEADHLRVESSGFGLCVKPETTWQAIRIEYDRDKSSKQPSHLQISGESTALGAAYALAGQPIKHLHKLHIPLGDRRFRPSVEDFIEFLCQENLAVDRHERWQRAIAESRGDWIGRQVRAAVRRSPNDAVDQLQRMGYRVEPPQ